MEKRYSGTATNFYYAPSEISDLVNLAIALRRPLLIEGEPGCGKTQLAYSVAAELGLGKPERISVKSTSRARDLLYRYDAMRRLQDAQGIDKVRAQSVYPYIALGPLGAAIHAASPRRVVLLDEVDKADIDFPNDILDVLDEYAFTIEDLPASEEAACLAAQGFGRQVSSAPREPPIVLITSNREKRLPEPFLRRCIFIELRFPETESELRQILEKNVTVPPSGEALVEATVRSFLAIRRRAVGAAVSKPPATSELIDWVRALFWDGAAAADLKGNEPRWWRILFKIKQDIEAYVAASETTE